MSTIVTTRNGKVQGEDLSGLHVFRGIPFAAAPTGARRWTAPEAPAPWSGTRDATKFGYAAPQNPVMLSALAAMKIEQEQSEDCLFLNVWTPAVDRARRPVMVWIHGGAFTIGSGAQAIYDGSSLARRGDIVVVTINYRLGPLGFLRLADVTGGRIASTGNEGILDQIAALTWVRDNIENFGGDPENVLIFGESAGGMSVGTLLGMPAARGLFHKAIPQSGACHTASSVARANRVAERVISRLGASASNVDSLYALTPAQLLKGALLADGVTPDPELGMAYHPVADGVVLPRKPIDMVAEGSAAGVAVMVGSTLDEWKLFAVMDPGLARLDRAGLVARLSRRLDGRSEEMVSAYEAARSSRGESTSSAELFSAIESDRVFRMPGVRLAETQGAQESRTYSYMFTWRSPAMGGILGSCHALELGFVFGTNQLPGMSQFSGTGAVVEKIEHQMQNAWLAFARCGNPSNESIGDWPGYTEARRATMIFGSETSAQDAPYDAERRAWDAISNNVVGAL